MSELTQKPSEQVDDLKKLKKVEYYSALVNAWVATRMERDKSLLALAGGGIGLLITLLSTNESLAILDILLCGVALVFFLSTIAACLMIFKKNADQLEEDAMETGRKIALLATLDRYVTIFFMHGIIFSMLFGLVNASHKCQFDYMETVSMSKQDVPKGHGPQKAKGSVDGIDRLNPDRTSSTSSTTQNDDKKSSDSQDSKK